MSTNDLINVGLSGAVDDKLTELTKEMGVFADKIDGYRFGVSLAIAHGAILWLLVLPNSAIAALHIAVQGSFEHHHEGTVEAVPQLPQRTFGH